jgi:hypothetical protein
MSREERLGEDHLGEERLAEKRLGGNADQVAVLVPCYNEKHAVAKVVADPRGPARGYRVRL